MVVVGIVGIIVLAIMIAMVICVIKYSEGMLRKIAVALYIIAACVIVVAILVGVLGSMKVDSDRAKYNISTTTILSGYSYQGNTIPGYHEIVSSGLFYADSILIPEESVEVSALCKIFTAIDVYYPKGDSEIIYTEEDLFISPWFYSVATNVVKLAPDPTWMALEIGIYDVMFFVPVNVILFIIVLVKLGRKEKTAKKQADND